MTTGNAKTRRQLTWLGKEDRPRRAPAGARLLAWAGGIVELPELDAHGGGRGRPVRRFALHTAKAVDVDTNSANAAENPFSVNVNGVHAADDDSPGCPDGEQPPDDIRFASCPEAAGTASADDADGWGEL